MKPLEQLIDIYEKSVGGNATFLLNIPPTPEGLLHENDVARLHQFGQYIANSYACNLVENAHFLDSSAKCLCRDDDAIYSPKPEIRLHWDTPQTIQRIVLKEQISLGQRVEAFCVEALMNGSWQDVANGAVIGHKKILTLRPVTTQDLRIRITDSRCEPLLRFFAIYA